MKRIHLAFISMMLSVTAMAQQDTVRKYLDAELHFATKKNFAFAAIAVKSNDHWFLYAVYPDTSALLKVYFKDAALTVKDGPFILYHPKGIAAQKGSFVNNVAQGHWQTYYPNGQIKEDGDIVNNHFSGQWKEWYKSGLPMSVQTYARANPAASGNQPVHENSPGMMQKVLDDFTPEGTLEGPDSTWYENGNQESLVNFHNDSLTGECRWFRTNGKPSSKETYANGKITDLECYDEDGKYTGATCSIIKLPVFIHPVFSAEDYIINELHKEKHRDIRDYGEASVSFTVTQKGTVANLVIANSPDAALSKHITQIIGSMPAWSPAVTHNRKVDYTVKIVIPYYGD